MNLQALGELIKSEREKRGWEQSTLASMIGVGQQAVSKWEKGGSKPRRDDLLKLVDLFSADPEVWLSHADYEFEAPDMSLVHFLPLNNLSPEKFELFCRDLVQCLNPNAEVDRYGLPGDDQSGIDLFAKEENKILDYQCKRHKQFGPADVKAVIKETTFKAQHHHLLLSRPATKTAKDEVIGLKNWSLWDRDIISAKVRALPKDDAIRIVDTYFQGARKRFLGIENPSPWLTSEEFYRQFINRKTLFSHGWDFYGRRQELDTLVSFQKKPEQALIVSGIGGVGKSRLIKAWSDQEEKSETIRFLSPHVDVHPQDYESLPEGKFYIVIDDAHDRTDLVSVLSGIFRFRPEARLILTTRPYGIAKLRDDLIQAGVSHNQEDSIVLKEMEVDDVQRLAEQVLNEVSGNTQYAKKIAQITRDCPLATVVGSQLVGQGKIRPELLNNEEEFRSQLLKSFRDIVAGKVGGTEPEAVKDLLDLVSMLQPVDPTDPIFQKAAHEILERRSDKIIRDIRALEEAGVLLRRGSRLRIAPDLLGDYIRAEAAYDEKARTSTGYADLVFNAVQDRLATNLLVNISQLDWRLTEGGAQASLLDEVWKNLKSQFKNAKIFERAAILTALEKVAYYQPKEILEFVQLALDEPTDKTEKEHIELAFRKPDYRYVVEKIPSLLRYIAYHEEYLIEAVDLLKVLAEEDKRATNPHPSHPLRVLQDLARIEPGKPLVFSEIIADHALKWLESDSKGSFSPFDVLDVFLETEGHQSETKGFTVSFIPFKVRAEAVAGIRKKVIDAAFKTIQTRSLKDALRALKTVDTSLSFPSGIFGQSISQKDLDAWEPGILETLQRLKELVADQKLDPLIATETRSGVSWHQNHSKTKTKQAAEEVIQAIPTTLDYEVTRALVDGWGWTFERADRDYRSEESKLAKWRKQVASDLISKFGNDFKGLVSFLEARLKSINEADYERHVESGFFLDTLFKLSRPLTTYMGESLLSNPESPLAPWFGTVVDAVARANYPDAIKLAQRGVDSGNLKLIRCVAGSLGRGFYNLPVLDTEIPLIRQLIKNQDHWVRRSIIWVFKRFKPETRAAALDMLLEMDISDSTEIADEVIGQFEEKHGIFQIKELSEQQLQLLLEKLTVTPSIEDYHIGLFLKELSVQQPQTTLKFLKARVEYKETHPKVEDYRPLPYSWRRDEAPRFSETPHYEQMLREVRDWAAEPTGDWVRFHFGSELFKLISAGFDAVTLKVLKEWLLSSDKNQVKVASSFLSEAGKNFVWSNEEFVSDLLEEANRLGSAYYERISGSLYLSVVQGGRNGAAGEPFPEDIRQRDISLQRMEKLPAGSPVYKFYKMLHEAAKKEIQRHTDMFLELEERE